MADSDQLAKLDEIAVEMGLPRGDGDPDYYGYPNGPEGESDVIIEDNPF